VKYDDGTAKIIEYASPSQRSGTQKFFDLEKKVAGIVKANENLKWEIIPWGSY
jgi:hypothetical protein